MRVTKPPKFPLKLLKWFCRSNYHADIEGDLLELYGRNLSKHGQRRANRLLIIDVLLLFRPGILKNLKGQNQIYNSGMFHNYFKVTWRNLLRQKLYAFINIVGLAVGITCFILIYLFVEHERSYDRFYENVDNIYHVYEHAPGDTYLGSDLYAVTPAQLAPTLMEGYPEVEYATTLSEGSALLGKDQTDSYWEKGLSTDKYFFKVFSSPFFIHGNPNTAFDHPESIVLTISLSRKIFQEENAVGKTLVYRNKPYLITGVIQDPPKNSTFQFSFMANLKADDRHLNEFKKEKWDGSNYYSFFTLLPSADPLVLQDKMRELIDKYWTDDRPFDIEYIFQPLSAMHLRADLNNDFDLKGNKQQIALFITLAVLILALACINYMNLSIARSMTLLWTQSSAPGPSLHTGRKIPVMSVQLPEI